MEYCIFPIKVIHLKLSLKMEVMSKFEIEVLHYHYSQVENFTGCIHYIFVLRFLNTSIMQELIKELIDFLVKIS